MIDIPQNERYKDTVTKVAAFLLDYWDNKTEHSAIDIYTWPDDNGQDGLRVAEVSLSTMVSGFGSGASFMQSDPECIGTICAVERLILEWHTYPENDDPDDDAINELNDAKWRALYLVYNRDTATKFSDSLTHTDTL